MNEMSHDPTRTDGAAQPGQCMVCGHRDLRALYEVTDTNQDVPGRWDILACNRCGLGILSPFPSTKQVSAFYRDQFYTEEGQRFRGWVEKIRRRLAHRRGNTLNRLVPNRGQLLDFGSGAGHFAAAQAEMDWEVVAIDPYSNPPQRTNGTSVEGDSLRLDYPDCSFDAITLWYVIEHLANPRQVIGELRRILKPGGILALAQQDFASVQARLFGPRWLFLDPPRHLWQFTVRSLSELVRQQGFKIVALDRASSRDGPIHHPAKYLECDRWQPKRSLPLHEEPTFARDRPRWLQATAAPGLKHRALAITHAVVSYCLSASYQDWIVRCIYALLQARIALKLWFDCHRRTTRIFAFKSRCRAPCLARGSA